MNFGYPHSPTVVVQPIEKYNFVQTGRFDVTPRMRVSGSVYLTSYEAEDASGSVEEDSYMQIFEYVRVTVLWMYDLMIEQS